MWSEYKGGFGDVDAELGEFWLGNDNLHYITTQGKDNLLCWLHLKLVTL